MKPKVPKNLDLQAVYSEVNRLRRRDGLEPVGGLGFAAKLVSHFHESESPRVAEALRNIKGQCGCPAQ